MKRCSGAGGFTIVETLIVLAVTGGMLVMAFTLINGRQGQAQFEQGVRTFQLDLQQVINEVGNGYYLNNDDLECVASSSPLRSLDITARPAGSVQRGTNQACIFFGKAVQFAVNGSPDAEQFNIYTVAALRANASGNTLNLAQARPMLIADSGNGFPDRYDTKRMPFGMKVASVSYDNNGTPYSAGINPVRGIVFTSSLSSLDSVDKNQQVNVIAIPAPTPGFSIAQPKAATVGAINTSLNNASIQPAQTNPVNGVQICVNSGSSNRSALFKIGGDGGQTTVGVSVKNNPNCI